MLTRYPCPYLRISSQRAVGKQIFLFIIKAALTGEFSCVKMTSRCGPHSGTPWSNCDIYVCRNANAMFTLRLRWLSIVSQMNVWGLHFKDAFLMLELLSSIKCGFRESNENKLISWFNFSVYIFKKIKIFGLLSVCLVPTHHMQAFWSRKGQILTLLTCFIIFLRTEHHIFASGSCLLL